MRFSKNDEICVKNELFQLQNCEAVYKELWLISAAAFVSA